jgi:hypothetical protein
MLVASSSQFRAAARTSLVPAGPCSRPSRIELIADAHVVAIFSERLAAVRRSAVVDVIVDALYCDIVTTRRQGRAHGAQKATRDVLSPQRVDSADPTALRGA